MTESREETTMLDRKNRTDSRLMESSLTGNSYFGNPYMLAYEQYGLENLDRNRQALIEQDSDEVESVVILGYN